MKRRITAFLLCAAVIFTTAVAASADANIIIGDNNTQIIGDNNTVIFADVPSSFWAKDEIESFYQQGIVNGYADGSFHPSDGVRRAEFCKMLTLAFQNELPTPEAQAFSDVPSAHWAYAYVDICKDFMTGYANPFGGLPAFHPNEYATREDIAVALVKMMGLSKSDTSNANLAATQFTDGDSISPNLVPYVSIAYERGLISGYPDGTFRPTKGITRAETVVLLNRVSKQAMADIDKEVRLDCVGCFDEDGKTYRITIFTDGSEATVNGTPIDLRRVIMPSTNTDTSRYPAGYIENGIYPSYYEYVFEQEGTQTFTVIATNGKKSKTETLTAEYKIDGPTLNVTSCPTRTDQDSATISGNVSDVKDEKTSINLTVNGESVYVNYSGAWEKTVSLREGENTFTFVATNTRGKTATAVKTIVFEVGAPDLNVTSCPTKTDQEKVTISGNVSDENDEKTNVNLTINGESVYVNYSGMWSANVSLKKGENTFTIVATNTLGKSTTVTKTILYPSSYTPPAQQESSQEQTQNTQQSTEQNAHVHTYGSWITDKAATCTETGTKHRVCSECGYSMSQSISKTEHNYGSWITDTRADCTKTGTKHRACKTCGYTETATIAKESHFFGDWIIDEPATSVSNGSKHRSCSSCGYRETQSIPATGGGSQTSNQGTASVGGNAVANYSWRQSGNTVDVQISFIYGGGSQHDSIQAAAKIICKSGGTTSTEIVKNTIPANTLSSGTTVVRFTVSGTASVSVTKA